MQIISTTTQFHCVADHRNEIRTPLYSLSDHNFITYKLKSEVVFIVLHRSALMVV